MSSPGLDFLVKRTAWREHQFVEPGPPGGLTDGQVLFRVDRFALTANNISYALTGDALGYWRFFPAEPGWGRIPAMGFGDVIDSRHPDVAVGTRCFGFYPMSRYLTIEPGAVSPAQIVDSAAHREGLAPVYNQYAPVASDSLHAREHEDAIMLLRGLFMTSFLAEDFLEENERFGASDILISSASSKTSIALAFVAARTKRARTVGLTSATHRAFVEGLGLYDEVAVYEDLPQCKSDTPTVFVDMAGNANLLQAVHQHFGDALKYSCRIGATHWEAAGDPGELVGGASEFFFAPRQIQKRVADWGPDGFQERVGTVWAAFRDSSKDWLEVERGTGRKALVETYLQTLEGKSHPNRGHVLSLWDDELAGSET